MQITLNQAEVEAAIQAYVDEQVNYPGEASIVVNADGTASIGINEEVSHDDDTPPVVEKKTRRPRKSPQEAKHRPVEPETGGVVEEVKVEETQTSTGGPNGSSTPEPEEGEAVTEPEAQEEVVQEEVKAEEPAEKPATKPSLFAGLKRS